MRIYLVLDIPFVKSQLKIIELFIYHTRFLRGYIRKKFTEKYSQFNAHVAFQCPKCSCSFGQWVLTFFGFRLYCNGCYEIIEEDDYWE